MLELVTGLVPHGEEDHSDEPVRFYAENQTWDTETIAQLRKDYGVIFNGGIRAFMLIERGENSNPFACYPLIAVGYEDDGVLSFEKQHGHYSNLFSAYWIDSIVECLKAVGEEASTIERCEGEGSNLTWTLDANGVLTISGTGAMANYAEETLVPWGTEITQAVLNSGVTSIGDYAFWDCNRLTSVTIPEGVTSIGESAFEYTSLTDVAIPSGVTSIGDGAFCSCGSLTSVTIPDGVPSIGVYAFADCSSLISLTIPSSVTSIGEGAFSGCTSLTSVTIPASVTSIGEYAFYCCDSLTDVYYSGSETDWAAISIASDNAHLTSATIHYNSTGPEVPA